MKTFFLLTWVLVINSLQAFAQDAQYKFVKDIIYTSSKDEYSLQQCRMDFYYPQHLQDFTTLIWFHGGGLTSGNKDIPEELKNQKFAVLSVGYRFAPKVRVEDILKDGAEAINWLCNNIESYGGSRTKIVIGGYSAGGYIALMLGLRKDLLQKHHIDVDHFLGVISCSGQTITHFTERKSLNMHEAQPLVNEMAPLYWVRKTPISIMLITGDREKEMVGRYEENAYLARMLKIVGNQNVELLELQGYDHGMLHPAFPLLIRRMNSF